MTLICGVYFMNRMIDGVIFRVFKTNYPDRCIINLTRLPQFPIFSFHTHFETPKLTGS